MLDVTQDIVWGGEPRDGVGNVHMATKCQGTVLGIPNGWE